MATAATAPRKVLLREGMRHGVWGEYAEAIPEPVIREVFGDVTPDPRVEFLVLSFEYWLHGGATPNLQLQEMMRMLPNRLTPDNAYRLVSLLAKRGVADDFFDLASTSIDRNGEFRRLLLENGILIDTIRHYATWHGINPREFLNGFLFGVAQSVASVVFDLADLVKLIYQVHQAVLREAVRLATNPDSALGDLWGQVEVVRQASDALKSQLDPTRLPAALVGVWRDWNATFERHLEELDAFGAGRHLGMVAGTLWDLLTGIKELAHLIGAGGRAALEYAALLVGRARSAAREAAAVLGDLVKLLKKLGQKALHELPRVGLGVLHTLFPPKLLRQLVEEGRAFLTFENLTLIPVYQPAYAMAFGGARMPTDFAAIIAARGKPLMMAVTSERLPRELTGMRIFSEGRTPELHAEFQESVDATLTRLDDLRDPTVQKRSSPDQAKVAAKAMEQLEQRLVTHLTVKLQIVAYGAFRELRARGRKFYPNELGTRIHTRMAAEIGAVIGAKAPGSSSFAEKTIGTIYDSLAADPALTSTLASNAKSILNEPIAAFVARRPDLMDLIGIDKAASARTPDAVAKALKRRFKWSAETTAGSLKCDLAVTDANARRLVNVDWTSSTNYEEYEEVWRKVVDDLKGNFNGDLDTLAEAYRKAHKREIPQEVVDKLRRLTAHADRETVVRKVILQEVLGNQWFVTSHEVLYRNVGQLWQAEKASRKVR